MNDYVVRIHLKTDASDLNELVDFCLNSPEQCVAIGWSCLYDEFDIHSFADLYNAVKEKGWRLSPVFNIFWDAQADDLFWTRDLEWNYWICRAKEGVKPYLDEDKDIGAIIPVEAYNAGKDVREEVKARCLGTAKRIYGNSILQYSKDVFDKLRGKSYYGAEPAESNVLANLQAFGLQELVVLYLQIKHNYCVLSNSIVRKAAAPEIECELVSRNVESKQKAIVRVKVGNDTVIDALGYKDYAEDGCIVYLYAPRIENADKVENVVVITDESLRSFYNEYKEILSLCL